MRRPGALARSSEPVTLVALAAVVAVAALLRFYDLAHRGLLYWDEGKFALEGVRMLTLAHNLLGAHDATTLGKAVGTAKPGHALFIALSYAVLGVHDFSPLYFDAAASVLSVPLTFLIGRRLFDRDIGLAAALLLATSEYDAIYARSALSESDAVVLFLLAVWVWMRWGTSARATVSACGVLTTAVIAGCAFTINYRMLVYVAALVCVDILSRLRVSNLSMRTVLPSAAWLALFAGPLAWQTLDFFARAHGVTLFRNEIMHNQTTYLAQAAYQVHEGKQSVVRFEPLAYMQWYVVRQGWWSVPPLLLALAAAAERRTFGWLVPAALVVMPYAIFITAPFVVPRNMVAALPFTSILIAALLLEAARRVTSAPWKMLVGPVAALLLALADISLAWRITQVRSGLSRAASYVAHHDTGRAVVSNEVMEFYLRGGADGCLAPRLPPKASQLAADLHYGFRYLVLDRSSNSPVDRLVTRRLVPVASYSALGPVSLGEDLLDSENTLTPGTRRRVRDVHVYDLSGLGLPAPRKPVRPVCDREVLP